MRRCCAGRCRDRLSTRSFGFSGCKTWLCLPPKHGTASSSCTHIPQECSTGIAGTPERPGIELGKGKAFGGRACALALRSLSMFQAPLGTLRDAQLCPFPLRLSRACPGSLCTKRIICISSCCWDYYLFYPSARQMEKLSLEGYKSGPFIHLYCSGSADCWKGTPVHPWEGMRWCAALSARQPQGGFQLHRATRCRSYASNFSS